MAERPPSSSSNVWKSGTKGLSKMANSASHAARAATDNIASVASSSSRRKNNETGSYTCSSGEIGESDMDMSGYEKQPAKNKNMFKKTYKSLKKGANKVNPLRMAGAVMSQKDGDASRQLSMMDQLGTDEAEDAVLSSIEKRSSSTQAGEDGFRPAIDGETPPFRVPTLGNAFARAMTGSSENVGADDQKPPTPSLKTMTQKIIAMQRLGRASKVHQDSSRTNTSNAQGHHRRARTLLDAIGNDKHDDDAQDDLLLGDGDNFRDFQKVFDADPNEYIEMREEGIHNSSGRISGEEELDEQSPHEGLPLLGGDGERSRDTTDSERQWRARQLLVKSQLKRFVDFIDPSTIATRICRWFLRSTLMLAIPLFIAAWILFYYCGNPLPPEFLPGSATLSWWFNFTGRQLVIFELARVSQFFMIDLVVLHTRAVSRALGPWVTIFCLQSKGWPFIVGSWGVWALLLLQGNSNFDYHWLYFTGIRIYSAGNSGSYIINSEVYLRILLAMIVTGVFTTLKRTLSTLYFGRRMFDAYKPRLEEILNDIILISEVADLSIESDNIASVIGVEKKERKYEPPTEIDTPEIPTVKRGGRIRWSSVKFEDASILRSGSQSLLQGDEDNTDTESKMTDDGDSSEISFYDSNSSRIPLKELLDRWQEPVSKKDKTINASVNDILKFRQALTYMDLDYPFSEAFGRASTRNEMILSAEAVYNRLMNLSSEHHILSFSVFNIILLQEDGSEDKDKRRALRNLFRPDRRDHLTVLSFVQSCDTIYKKIRYFRASVGNASVIDQVLESIIDVVFYFTLGLIVLSLLNLNPWPLLVSMSTLLVTASFAVGPSCAKAIEGILLIVGRRPFDIGDRIIISDTPGAALSTMGSSWFVEDISLFSTTLRLASSNEVATVSNGS
ncbi:mechanosensitive ion channel [Nitzschia inconspicua]|uniref:Mechanosensitive ion channel n=1 Tax=Nitzschia inconspicua TaxID=303405 RepID=A0A9K3PUE4_9STRA|nr:mechanosensitive ion channel [Nitzschia inconspicua]